MKPLYIESCNKDGTKREIEREGKKISQWYRLKKALLTSQNTFLIKYIIK
jgi:hypothetical protein